MRPNAMEGKPVDAVYQDLLQSRAAMAAFTKAYSEKHPPHSYGYTATYERAPLRDGESILVKVNRPVLPEGASPPPPGRRAPLLIQTHGGAWKEGDAVIEEAFGLRPLLSRLSDPAERAEALRPVVVSPEYHLVPEHPYPDPVHDCLDAAAWALTRAEAWGADPNCVLLGGSSAGAQLALVIALEAVRGNVVGLGQENLKGLMLNVPAICHPAHWEGVTREPPSYNEDLGELGGAVARKVWGLFHPGTPADGDWRLSPFLADVHGLPPTNIFAAERCPFRSEGEAYYEKLQAAGVVSTLHIYQGAQHGFAADESHPTTQQFHRDAFAAWKALLNHDTAANARLGAVDTP